MNQVINNRPLNGTRDFYPDMVEKRRYIFDVWASVAKSHNFQEYDAPIIERTELYTRKGGDDIIKEMYHFETEKQKVCLRPEVTPSLVRMISGLRINSPLKWFSIAQCWRFETVTTFRKREHYQLNCDIVAGAPVKSEVEILSIVVDIFKNIGFSSKDVHIRISHRGVMYHLLKSLEIKDDVVTCIMQLLDKVNKISEDEFKNKVVMLEGMNVDKVNTLISFTKITMLVELDELLANIPSSQLALNELGEIFKCSKYYDFADWLVLDLSIMRGLDYYTGLVFECFSTRDDFNRAICGGGRYDNIMTTYGFKKSYSFVGFGMGDVVLQELITLYRFFPEKESDVVCLVSLSEERYSDVLKVANAIRLNTNVSVDVVDKVFSSEKAAMKYVDGIGPMTAIVFLGGVKDIMVKSMQLGRDDVNKVKIYDVNDYIKIVKNE